MKKFFLLLALVFLFTVQIFSQQNNSQRENFLPSASPEKCGFSSAMFRKFTVRAEKEIPSLASFLVWRHNALAYEQYFHGQARDSANNIKSVTKTMISAMAGAAQLRGLLPDLDTPVMNILSEYSQPRRSAPGVWFSGHMLFQDSILGTLTLRQLLTMQAGFESSDSGPMGHALCSTSDPVRFMIDLPFIDEGPGQIFNYSTGASIVFGAALAKSVKTDLLTFADSALFAPLGIRVHQWDKDPEGRYIGGSEMFMTAQDLMRLGILYLNKGVMNNKRILGESWVNESTSEHAKLNKWDVLPGANGYGYYWWRRVSQGHQIYVASGYGGQLIWVIPDLDMVAVATCTLGDNNRGRAEIPILHKLLDSIIKEAK